MFPLPYKNVLKYRTREKMWAAFTSYFSIQNVPESAAHLLPRAVLRINLLDLLAYRAATHPRATSCSPEHIVPFGPYRHASTFECWRSFRAYRDILPQSSAALATEFQQFFPNQIVSYVTPALENTVYFTISYVWKSTPRHQNYFF
jgi:hypothetical protein